MYSVEFPSCENESQTKAILKAASYLELTKLKICAEERLAYEYLKIDNAVELLLCADAHVCALLKEEAMTFCLSYLDLVKQTPGWQMLKESTEMYEELLAICVQEVSMYTVDSLDVKSLRDQLESYGLDIDGTREMLVARLKAARN
jgi:hypothetical protein